jgi:hypothetical protein
VVHTGDDSRALVAPSFADLLSRYFDGRKDGTIDLSGEEHGDEDDD